jgi:hypothetical protein
MTTCNTCNNAIPDPAEQWPNGNGGTLCQECWEAKSSRMWWGAVIPFDQEEWGPDDGIGSCWTAGVGKGTGKPGHFLFVDDPIKSADALEASGTAEWEGQP